jgi:hypothetical protein
LVQPTCSSHLECILTKCTVHNLPGGMRAPVKQLGLSRNHLRRRSSPKEWDQVLQQFLHIFYVWGLEIDSEAGEKNFEMWVRVKDSGSIQGVLPVHSLLNCHTKNSSVELDDDNKDFLNNATSSSTKPNSRTHSTQKDEEIRTSTRHNHSNTTQGTGTPTSIKPTRTHFMYL